MKDLTKEEIKGIIKESNKDLLDEIYIDDEARMARVNHSDTYAYSITQAADLLQRMTDNAAMEREAGNLSDSALEELLTKQVQRIYDIAATVENTLRAIKAGTYRRAGRDGTTDPTIYRN